jgi:hypothetical protein
VRRAAGLAPHAAVLVVLAARAAATPTLEERSAALPRELAPAVAKQLSGAALVVRDGAGPWLTLFTPADPDVPPGALGGVLVVESGWRDFRDRAVPAGVYTLRRALQPNLKEHAGTSPSRDFLLLVPARVDDGGARAPEGWIAASRGIAGPHPAVLCLLPAPSGARARLEDADGRLLLVPSSSRFALVLKGHGVMDGF